MNRKNLTKTGAMVLSAMLIAGTGFGMIPASAAEKVSDDGMYTTTDYSNDENLQKMFDLYDNFSGGTDENGEPVLLATNPNTSDDDLQKMFDLYDNFSGGTDENGNPIVLAPNPTVTGSAIAAKPVKKNTVIKVNHKKLSKKGYQAKVTVNGKTKTTVMVPMNAFAKALGGKVKKTSDGWTIVLDGMNVNIVKGEDSYQFQAQKGDGTTAGLSYGSKPVTKKKITYIPVDVFKDVMTNITGNEPTVKLNKKANTVSFLVNVSD